MNHTNLYLIGILLITAVILGAMLLGSFSSEKAFAANAGDRTFDRDFIMVTGQISKKTCIVYVVHAPTRKIFAYVPDAKAGKLTLADVQPIQ